MAYRRPGIQVTQEFVDLLPALAAFNLPNCIVGPAYQVVTDDELGDYDGDLAAYTYAALTPGNKVDTAALNSKELQDHQFPIAVKLVDAKIEQIATRATGAVTTVLDFSDATLNAFGDVVANDELEILAGANEGVYRIRSVVNANTLRLAGPVAELGSSISYRILRKVDVIELERGEHFEADDVNVEVFAGLTYGSKVIVSGIVQSSYRALRSDLAGSTREYKDLADVQAVFGVGQIVPANPLAFGISLALQNTVTGVNGLGLQASFLTNETQAFQSALDVLKKTQMYALCPLSQSPVVHQLFSTHVTQMSLPSKGKERVAICNRRIMTEEIVVESTTTDGERIIVNTQTTGIVVLGNNTLEMSAATFGNVQPGDVVEFVGGTGVTPGDFVVEEVTSVTSLKLEGFTASYNGSNVQYFIKRPDGVEANGEKFYDSSAGFLTDDVVPGHFLVIEAGAFEGRYKVLSVDSNNQLTLDQIPGIVSVTSPVTYRMEKDMTTEEIAAFIGGYAGAFANRRLVMTWPDVVKVPEGSIIRELPGFYLGCAIAALTTGLPTQQGFTNLTVSGFLGFKNGSDMFDEDQLNTMADGGVMIFDQEVPEAPLYVRHQLTTDRSAIKYQEYSVTKNVDFIAKFLRDAFKGYIGKYNIVDETLDELKGTAAAVIKFLTEKTKFPAIGGVIRSGRLTELKEGEQIDTVSMRFRLDIPIPLNNIDITIQV